MKLNPELDNIESLARTILVAARTAPKGKGVDDIITYMFDGEEKAKLADKMEEMADIKGMKFFIRDAGNVRAADSIVIIGLSSSGVTGLNCGACGFETCKGMLDVEKANVEFAGPQCMIKYMDLGIAVGSAVAKAKDLCVDNRVLYSAAATACYFGMIDCDVAMSIPLSVKGKNIFFDRPSTR